MFRHPYTTTTTSDSITTRAPWSLSLLRNTLCRLPASRTFFKRTATRTSLTYALLRLASSVHHARSIPTDSAACPVTPALPPHAGSGGHALGSWELVAARRRPHRDWLCSADWRGRVVRPQSPPHVRLLCVHIWAGLAYVLLDPGPTKSRRSGPPSAFTFLARTLALLDAQASRSPSFRTSLPCRRRSRCASSPDRSFAPRAPRSHRVP